MTRPGISKWPSLRRKKVTVSLRVDRGPHDRAGRAVDAARQIDRDDGPARRRVHRLDRAARAPSTARSRPAPNSASTITPAPSRAPASRLDLALPASRRLRGIAAQRRDARRAASAHRIAALAKHPRRDKAIAAIVAGTRNDDDAAVPSGWRATASATARPAFSISAMPAVPPRNREPIALAHFVRRQQLVHSDHAPSSTPWWKKCRENSGKPAVSATGVEIIMLPMFWTNPRNGPWGRRRETAGSGSKTKGFAPSTGLAWTC